MSSPSKQGRSRNGCLVCKSRKVKCGEELDGCLNCQRLGVDCPGYDATVASQLPKSVRANAVQELFETAGVRKRLFGACRECRITKHRCTKERPQCWRCSRRRLPCIYEAADKSKVAEISHSPQISLSESVHEGSPSVDEKGVFGWLYSSALPEDAPKLTHLANTYFEHIHPLRTLAFIHRPTFMQSLDSRQVEDDYGTALVHIMFALASRYLKHVSDDGKGAPGEIWAERAHNLALQSLGRPCIQTLMTLILLCEYEMRYGQNSTVFMLSSCCFRMAQILRLDSEAADESLSSLPSATQNTERESRRRLMWSCYIIDIIVGSGIDGITMSSRTGPKIQLPCDSQTFTHQMASRVEYLLPDEDQGPATKHPLGLEAYFVRVMYLRGQILRAIRNSNNNLLPWSPNSDFSSLLKNLDELENGLPSHLRFNDLNIYIHKDQHQLGAFYAFHLAYHQCYCDLQRVLLPGYHFPVVATFMGAPIEFVQQCQESCQFHADAISRMTRHILDMGQDPFADPLCGICIYESTKLQVIYVTCVALNHPGLWECVTQNIETNLKALHTIEKQQIKRGLYLFSLCRLLKDFGFADVVSVSQQSNSPGNSMERQNQEDSTETRVPEFNHLHSLATYQLSWKEISRPRSARDTVAVRTPGPNTLSPDSRLQMESKISGNTRPSGPNTHADYETTIHNSDSFISPGMEAPTMDQYSQMAEGLQEFLTWDPWLFDSNNISNLMYE